MRRFPIYLHPRIQKCGQSTLMEIFQDYLKERGVKEEQIIAVNLEGYDFYELHEPARLYAYIKERISQGYRTYVF